MRDRFRRCAVLAIQRGRGLALGHQFEIQQAMGVVEGWPQNLTAGQILEGGADAAVDSHVGGIDRV